MSAYNAKLWLRTKSILQTDFLMREHIPEWLGNVKGKLILDAGCGEGYVARKLAQKGAIVKGIDNNSKMVKLAKSASKRYKIVYSIGNLLNAKNIFKNEKFDIVILSGTTADLTKNQLDRAINGFYGLLKSGGLLLLTTNHADSYFKNARSDWIKFLSKPKNIDSQASKIDFYTPDKKKAFSGKAFIHKPSLIKKLLEKRGYSVVKIYEPLATKKDMKHFPKMWVDEDKIPFHIAFLAKKK